MVPVLRIQGMWKRKTGLSMDHPSRAQTGDDTGGLAPNCLSLPGLGEYGAREASPSRSWKS